MSAARTIVAAYVPRPEGRAAVETAIAEARLRGAPLLVVQPVPDAEVERGPAQEVRDLVDRLADGVEVELRAVPRQRSGGTAVVWAADEAQAQLIVLGLRRRSPVGKLVLGSDQQDALLGASCPILAVKVPTAAEQG